MRIALASDHGGIELKKELYNYLLEKKYSIEDLSPINFDTDDYPDFAYKLCKSIQNDENDLGILICRSGIGMSIAANKMKGIYCARVTNLEDVTLACAHNGVNTISLDADFLDTNTAIEMIDAFLITEKLNDERHQRRYDKIIKIEQGEYNDL